MPTLVADLLPQLGAGNAPVAKHDDAQGSIQEPFWVAWWMRQATGDGATAVEHADDDSGGLVSFAEIGEIRGNRSLTIRNAIYGIQNKLGMETKHELVVWAVRNGLLDDCGADF